MADARKKFTGRITKATGENEAIEITFAGDNAGELKTALKHAADAIEYRMITLNAKVLKVGAEVQKRVDLIKAQVRAEIEADVRAELAARGAPDPSAVGDEGYDAVAAAG